MYKRNYGCGTLIVVYVLALIAGPILSYLGGYITGLILQWFIGDSVVYGMNYLFNTTRFTTDMLPIMCGTLGVIGSFFKSVSTSSSNSNKW
jgi:hypothetical protein